MKSDCVIKVFFCILLFFTCFNPIKSQDRNEQEKEVFKYIDDSDIFSLIDMYPTFKDSLDTVVQNFAEALLSRSIGNSEASIFYITEFLKEQDKVDDNLKIGALLMLADNFFQMQEYNEAVNVMGYIIETVTPVSDEASLKNLQSAYDGMAKYNNLPKRYCTRTNEVAEVNFEYKKVGRGELIFIPCKVNGTESEAIFDTGCSISNVSQGFALKNNIHITDKTVPMHGIGGASEGKIGIIDSLQIDNITYHDIVCVIRSSPTPVDSVADILFGLDLMTVVGEFSILPKEKKIIFPINDSPFPSTGINMVFMDKVPFIKAYSGNERLTFLFDSGSVGMEMEESYYLKHEEKVRNEGVKTEIPITGIGGTSQQQVYKLPYFPLQVGNRTIETDNMTILTNSIAPTMDTIMKADGNLGVDFIKACSKVTLNFRRSFIEIE